MLLNWFDARQAREFGSTLATFFIDRIPFDQSSKKNKTFEKRKAVLEKMFAQINAFKSRQSLNIYKKAQLGNAFKWKLRDAGYDPEFVDQLTNEIMLRF